MQLVHKCSNDIEFDFSNSENDTFKSMALTDLIKLDQISRKVYTVSSKDGFIPGQFWNGICAKHGNLSTPDKSAAALTSVRYP